MPEQTVRRKLRVKPLFRDDRLFRHFLLPEMRILLISRNSAKSSTDPSSERKPRFYTILLVNDEAL